MTVSCAIAWAIALLLLPILLLAWATESTSERARRWRRSGLSQRAIASRLGISRYRVQKLLYEHKRSRTVA